MTSTAPAIARLDSLTGVRAFAVALVFWHHANDRYEGISSGMVGVSLFYILSGFVMAWTARDNDTPWQFYRRRFARIYPAYFIAAVAAIVLLVAGGNLDTSDFAAFTLLQSWFPSKEIYFAASAVFWSLSCEAFFYLAFPLLYRFLRRMRDVQIAVMGAASVIVSLAIASVGATFDYSDTVQWAVVVFPLSRLPEFILGATLGTLVSRGWRPHIPTSFAYILAAAAITVAMFSPYALSRYAVTLIPFALLVVALAVSDIDGRWNVARWKPMVTLGVWSYCFYLTHLMVIHVTVTAMTQMFDAPLWAPLIMSLALSVVAAWLLHVVVERPAERWLRPAGRVRLDSDAAIPR